MEFGDYVQICCIFAFKSLYLAEGELNLFKSHEDTCATYSCASPYASARIRISCCRVYLCAHGEYAKRNDGMNPYCWHCSHSHHEKVYNNGMADWCDWPTRQTERTAWISALPTLHLRKVKENPAVDAISPLTLFLICLQALICFTDVARAPPPPRLWPNV